MLASLALKLSVSQSVSQLVTFFSDLEFFSLHSLYIIYDFSGHKPNLEGKIHNLHSVYKFY